MLLATEAGADYTNPVVVLSLVAGVIAFLVGLAMLVSEWQAEHELKKVAKKATQDLATPQADLDDKSPVKAQGGLDSAINAIANLAKTLKDLDRSTRLLVIALTFFAIAAVAAVGGAIAA